MDLGFDLLLEARDPDHEELVEVRPVDRDEFEPLEQRVARVEGLLEDPVVERQPRQLAVDVEPGIVERPGGRFGADLFGGLRIGDHRG